MKLYVLTAIAAVLMIGGASAHEVAYCDPGFNIKVGPGDKAACAKVTQEWVNKGQRSCLAGGHIVNDEAGDGGDKCSGTGIGSLVSGPAVLCEIDPKYGSGYRTKLVVGGRDECQRQEQKTAYGDVKTRQE